MREAVKDEDDRELARRLFPLATAVLEDATEIAADAQSPRLGAGRIADRARQLRRAAEDVTALAEAPLVAVRQGANPPRP